MPVETYSVRYLTETSEALAGIAELRAAVVAFDAAADHSRAKLKGWGNAASGMERLGKSLDQLGGKLTGFTSLTNNATDLMGFLAQCTAEVGRLGKAIGGLRGAEKVVGNIASEIWRVSNGAVAGQGNLNQLGAALGNLGQRTATVAGVRAEVVGVQRSAYGARKNVEDLDKAFGKASVSAGGMAGAAASLKDTRRAASGLRAALGGAAVRSDRLGVSLVALSAQMAVLQGLKEAIQGAGKALGEAREEAEHAGGKNLDMRDRYRELANLQGKAHADDAVMASAFRLRTATGLTDTEANSALRRFEGSLPAGKDKGNITGSSAGGVAADVLKEGVTLGLRTQMKPGTAADLSASLAQYGKIPDAKEAAGQMGMIVELLNRGRGDIDPLVDAMLKNMGNLVGKGAAIRDPAEFAAFQSVASLNASAPMSGTRIQQAMRELYGFQKDQGDHMRSLGMSPEKRGIENLNLLFSDMAKAEQEKPGLNLENYLASKGFKNSQGRSSITQMYRNRDLLNQLVKQSQEGRDGAKVMELNKEFLGSDDAQRRIGRAENDATKFEMFRDQEGMAAARERAEARLRAQRKIDTPAAKEAEAGADLFVPRILGGVFGALALGRAPRSEDLPLSMGGKSSRDMAIDNEARRLAEEEAWKRGIDPEARQRQQLGPDFRQAQPGQRWDAVGRAVQGAGGNPFGDGGEARVQIGLMAPPPLAKPAPPPAPAPAPAPAAAPPVPAEPPPVAMPGGADAFAPPIAAALPARPVVKRKKADEVWAQKLGRDAVQRQQDDAVRQRNEGAAPGPPPEAVPAVKPVSWDPDRLAPLQRGIAPEAAAGAIGPLGLAVEGRAPAIARGAPGMVPIEGGAGIGRGLPGMDQVVNPQPPSREGKDIVAELRQLVTETRKTNDLLKRPPSPPSGYLPTRRPGDADAFQEAYFGGAQ